MFLSLEVFIEHLCSAEEPVAVWHGEIVVVENFVSHCADIVSGVDEVAGQLFFDGFNFFNKAATFRVVIVF